MADYFGETSDEAAAAAVYFGGYNNSLTKPQSVFFYRANTEAVAGFFRGGPAPALSEITALTTGTLTGQIGTEAISLSGVDLSGAASYSAAAETLQTALRAAGTGTAVTAATVTYSSLTGAFTITAGEAAAGVNVDVTGGTVAEALGFTAAGAAVSPGADAETWTQILNTVAAQSQNFATFTTVTELTSAADALAIAGWVQTQYNTGSQFLHVLWTTDAAVTVAGDTTSPVAQVREAEPEGVAAVYGGIKYAAFIMGAAASIAWDYANSMCRIRPWPLSLRRVGSTLWAITPPVTTISFSSSRAPALAALPGLTPISTPPGLTPLCRLKSWRALRWLPGCPTLMPGTP